MNNSSSRVVVITGGSKGIGRAVAFRFAEEEARIVLVHYDPDEAESNTTLNALSKRGLEAESHRVDVSSFEAVDVLFKDILSRFGKIDVLVNNAGITKDTLLMRMSEEVWDTVIRVNLKSVFNCTQAVIRPMIKQRGGRIVSISSVVGQIGNAGQANYSASKAGIMGFIKTIAREVAARGITVNAVAPGFIDTDMTAVLSEKVKESFMRQIPLGRMGKPEEVAEAVYWLCSGAASYITGQVIHVSGGLYM
ncbi:MAG: 3-oxoacyl-[acyl-carrier-protein] reductase [Deltaproteobacteria bacterium]|nr:3-oxoacyl-[acyl-carrier-protein] reductase [Deltaproteobacteria bacterium]MBW1736564.1 3-oxoacyl-[acyl-carrier-protein] reductase [Deltaproteobacteria bacterium]MBW1908044.1 3-oxoacyl-[acyl-carrier-protein] reductase [Deltaproteobacteria bacterium]MBW2033627.1 3-oxoacyl-[acyl-carrier-protein] reductase [Deltaproteobacteria bacterium]MBW2113987.1 3-oxoacyl-[acyl-carrier-protein] reductase [Deltaproteobacteria bacterium]